MTLDDLRKDIKTKQDLRRILGLKSKNPTIENIWRQINPDLKPQMDKLTE